MVAEALGDHVRQEARPENALRDHALGARRGHHAFPAPAAGVLRACQQVYDREFEPLELARDIAGDLVQLAATSSTQALLGRQLVERLYPREVLGELGAPLARLPRLRGLLQLERPLDALLTSDTLGVGHELDRKQVLLSGVIGREVIAAPLLRRRPEGQAAVDLDVVLELGDLRVPRGEVGSELDHERLQRVDVIR